MGAAALLLFSRARGLLRSVADLPGRHLSSTRAGPVGGLRLSADLLPVLADNFPIEGRQHRARAARGDFRISLADAEGPCGGAIGRPRRHQPLSPPMDAGKPATGCVRNERQETESGRTGPKYCESGRRRPPSSPDLLAIFSRRFSYLWLPHSGCTGRRSTDPLFLTTAPAVRNGISRWMTDGVAEGSSSRTHVDLLGELPAVRVPALFLSRL